MKYAKSKSGLTFVEVDDNYEGRCVILNDKMSHISTYSCGKRWFFIEDKSFYDSCTQKEFENALQEAKNKLSI